MSRTLFYIWSIEHSLWWKPNTRGYTKELESAGTYTLKDAIAICQGANSHLEHRRLPNEAMVPILAEVAK